MRRRPRDRSTSDPRDRRNRVRGARRLHAPGSRPHRFDGDLRAAHRDARVQCGHVAAARGRQHAGRSVRGVGLSRIRAAHPHARQPSRRTSAEVSNLHELSPRRRADARTPRRSSACSRASPSSWIAAGAVVPIEDRINYCFTRSLAGSKLPSDSREMQDIVAYLAFISKGVPNGEHVRGEGLPKMPKLFGDSPRGRKLFADNCARCHGNDGAGMGPDPRAVGREVVQHRRVDGATGARRVVHSPQHAVRSSRARSPISRRTTSPPTSRRCRAPIRRARKCDWPTGGAPTDVPYDTKGHKAFRPPKVLPRDQPGRGDRRAPAVGASTSSRYRSAHEPTTTDQPTLADRRHGRRRRRRAALQAPGRRRSAASDGCARRRASGRAGDPTKAPGAPTTAVGDTLAVRHSRSARRSARSRARRSRRSRISPERSRRPISTSRASTPASRRSIPRSTRCSFTVWSTAR